MSSNVTGLANDFVETITSLVFPLLTVAFIVIFAGLILRWSGGGNTQNRDDDGDEEEETDDEEEEEPKPKKTGNTKQITNEEFGSEEMRNETGVNWKLIIGAVLVITIIGVLKYASVI